MSLTRKTPLNGGLPFARSRSPRRHKDTGFSSVVRALVMDRCGGICEKCGDSTAVQLHHRRPRGAGGTRRTDTNQPSNALALCEGCHRYIESHRDWSTVHGWLVNQAHSPAAVTVCLHHGWAVLDDAGRFHHLPEDAA